MCVYLQPNGINGEFILVFPFASIMIYHLHKTAIQYHFFIEL